MIIMDNDVAGSNGGDDDGDDQDAHILRDRSRS